jgi:hypothetical protein
MMFLFHIALALELIALVIGSVFLLHVKTKGEWKNKWTLFVGYFVVALAAISILCSIYSSFKYKTWMHKYKMEMMSKK